MAVKLNGDARGFLNRVDLGGTYPPSITNLTMMVWIRIDALQTVTSTTLYVLNNVDGGQHAQWWISSYTPAPGPPYNGHAWIQWNIWNGDGAWPVGSNYGLFCGIPTLGSWHHYTYVKEGNAHRLYIDGVLKDSTTLVLPDPDGWTAGYEFLGAITGEEGGWSYAQWRTWTAALTPEEIELEWHSRNAVKTANLFRDVPFDTVSGADTSGQGHSFGYDYNVGGITVDTTLTKYDGGVKLAANEVDWCGYNYRKADGGTFPANTTNLTYMLWLRVDGEYTLPSHSGEMFYSLSDGWAEGQPAWGPGCYNSTASEAFPDMFYLEIFNGNSAWSESDYVDIAIPVPAVGEWHHYAYVQEGTHHRVYVDGVQYGTDTIFTMPAVTDSWAGGIEEIATFQGGWALSQLRVWNTALTQSEIDTERHAETAVITTNLHRDTPFLTTAGLDNPITGRDFIGLGGHSGVRYLLELERTAGPSFPTVGQMSFVEASVPYVLTRGRTSWAQMGIDYTASAARISYVNYAVPFLVTSGTVSYARLRTPVLSTYAPSRRTILTHNYQTINIVDINETLQPSDEIVFVSGAVTLTLYPTVARPGHNIVIKNIGLADVTVNAADSETIDGSSSFTIVPNWCLSLLNSGGAWYRVYYESTI